MGRRAGFLMMVLACGWRCGEAAKQRSSSLTGGVRLGSRKRLSLARRGATRAPGGGSAARGSAGPREAAEFAGALTAVAALTSCLATLYGLALSGCVDLIWWRLPASLLPSSSSLYLPATVALGGVLIGVATSGSGSRLPGAQLFIEETSSSSGGCGEPRLLGPWGSRTLLRFLALCLATSSLGFSVGPEAPMVVAGAVVAAAVSRLFYPEEQDKARILAQAGAAGALTAFLGLPLPGALFALEMGRPGVGLDLEALGPSLFVAALAHCAKRGKGGGGHFAYGLEGVQPAALALTAVSAGVAGALVAAAFAKSVKALRGLRLRLQLNNLTTKTAAALIVALIATLYPQTLLWGEPGLQSAIDGQRTPLHATKHGLSAALTTCAWVDPQLPLSASSQALQIGLAKLAAIVVACAAGFPGGVIFPLFAAGASLARGCPFPAHLLPALVLALMASVQASATRTPLSTALILTGLSSATDLKLITFCTTLTAALVGVATTRCLHLPAFFTYPQDDHDHCRR